MPEDEETIRSLPEGTILFHGTSGEESFQIPRGPAFFTDDYGVARSFTTWHGDRENPRVLRFEVATEIPRLALIKSKETLDRLADEASMERTTDTRGRIEIVRFHQFDGWIMPDNYGNGADIMLFQPSRWLKFLDEESL
jgi:hypothetical protein